MKQLLRTPLTLFLVVNLLCFLLYLVPTNIYSLFLPVLGFDTTSKDLPVSSITQLLMRDNEAETLSDNMSLVFVGDVMLARHVEYLIAINGPEYPFIGSKFLLDEPAYVIGNFEATVPIKHKKTPNYHFQFSVNKNNLTGLVNAGFTHVSLANNHSLDYGSESFVNTKYVLTNLGIDTFGQPKSFGQNTTTYISASNTKYAIIGLNETQMEINQETLLPYIKEAETNSDVQVVYIHWGEEYKHEPSQAQKTIAKMLAEAGIDIIIGHHPHVIQSIEKIDNTLVFYSLGNYIFDQYFTRDVMEGLAIRLTRVDEELKVTLLPHSSVESHAQPKLLTGKNRDIILAEIADYSDENIAKMILSGEVFTTLSLATSTEIAIMNQ